MILVAAILAKLWPMLLTIATYSYIKKYELEGWLKSLTAAVISLQAIFLIKIIITAIRLYASHH